MWHRDLRIKASHHLLCYLTDYPSQSGSPRPPTDLTNTVSQETKGYRVQQISSTESSTTHSMIVGIPFSVFFFVGFIGDRERGGLYWRKSPPGLPGEPLSLRFHLSSEERIPQRGIHFSEAHIGYRGVGAVLTWPSPSSILP